MRLLNRQAIMLFIIFLGIVFIDCPVLATDVGGIIDTDTIWDLAGSPYNIKSRVQIAEGVNLTIEPGVVVNGESDTVDFYVWGNLIAKGNAGSKIFFYNVGRIDFQSVQTGNPSATFQYVQFNEQINNSGIQGPGTIIIRDSEIHSDGGFLVRSTSQSDMYIERNLFICDSLSYYIHIDGYSGTSSYVERNIFINTALQARSSSFYERTIKNNIFDGTSKLWTQHTCTEDVVIEHNSFLNTNRIVVSLYETNGTSMVARNNFWNTTDIETIDSMIWDRNDTLIIDGYVEYLPILTEPHPNTPTLNPKAEIIGTWSSGIWYLDVASSQWTKMTSSSPTGDIASGDYTGDGKADVASVWSSGLWYQDGVSLAWTKVGSAPNSITAGDVTGDGRSEIIGTWSSGIWYWDESESKWTKMAASTPTGDISAGDFTGDGKADVASVWDSGLWYQDGATLDWTKVPGASPDRLTAGDVTGDGRSEIIGTWSSGIWYWDVAESECTQMIASTPTGDIAAGDFTGDDKADVASIWDSGLWYQDGATLSWTRVGSAPSSLTAGDVTGD